MEDRSLVSAPTLRWFTQAALGVILLVLLAIHLIVHHWAAPQGLLTYADVIRYYDLPGIAWMEATFVVVVTIHCLLGLHSIFLDLNLPADAIRFLSGVLLVAGITAIGYGFWLIFVISSLPVS